jgi:hypothetical protein
MSAPRRTPLEKAQAPKCSGKKMFAVYCKRTNCTPRESANGSSSSHQEKTKLIEKLHKLYVTKLTMGQSDLDDNARAAREDSESSYQPSQIWTGGVVEVGISKPGTTKRHFTIRNVGAGHW